MPTGDKVIFPLVNQRVDKKDLDDMMVLLQQTISRTVGSLLGETSGALTTIPSTWNQTDELLLIGPCMLAYSTPKEGDDSNNLLEGGVVVHDPERPGQNGNSSVYLGGLSTGYLWFKRNVTNTDYDNRAHWPGPGTGEVVAPTFTREREFVTFAPTVAREGTETVRPANGWNLFAYFLKYDIGGGTTLVNVIPYSAFGDDRSRPPGGATQLNEAAFMGGWAASPTLRKWGLGRLAQDLISNILQIKDTDVEIDSNRVVTANPNNTLWRTPPTRGMRQIISDVSDVNGRVDYVESQINNLVVTSESLRNLVRDTPQVIGFVYLKVDRVGSTVTASISLSTGGPTAPLPSDCFSVSLISDPTDPIREFLFEVLGAAFIDHIAVNSSMRQDWTGGTAAQYINSAATTRGCMISFHNFPKSADSAPDAGDSGSGTVSPTIGQFVVRAKVASESANSEHEPFTLVVYGRAGVA